MIDDVEIVCGACGDLLKVMNVDDSELIPYDTDGVVTVWCEKCQKDMPDDYIKYASHGFRDWNESMLNMVSKK